MIISTFEEDNKMANVCKQQGEWVVMYYKDDEYIYSDTAYNQEHAEKLAEDWIFLGD